MKIYNDITKHTEILGKKWNKNELESALNNVNSTELLMKKNSQINNDTLIKDLIIRLCCSAFDSNSA